MYTNFKIGDKFKIKDSLNVGDWGVYKTTNIYEFTEETEKEFRNKILIVTDYNEFDDLVEYKPYHQLPADWLTKIEEITGGFKNEKTLIYKKFT